MVRVKICGITKWEDAKLCADLGAHAIGLNFYEASPRCVTPFAASELLRRLPPFIAPAGIFVNWEQAPIVALCKALRLSAWGREPPPPISAAIAALQRFFSIPPPLASTAAAAQPVTDTSPVPPRN